MAAACPGCGHPLVVAQVRAYVQEHLAVVVTDIRMPFWSMVTFMVKWAIASIPAAIVLTIIGVVCWAVFGAMIIGSIRSQ